MTLSEYSEKYGYARSSVKSWLRDGLIEGAEKMGLLWYIPAGARPRYKVRKKNNRTQNDNMFDFIRALNMRRYVDNVILGCSAEDYQDLVRILLEAGIIEKGNAPYDGKWNTGYSLTMRGLKYASLHKVDALKVLRTVAAGATEGAIRSQQGG